MKLALHMAGLLTFFCVNPKFERTRLIWITNFFFNERKLYLANRWFELSIQLNFNMCNIHIASAFRRYDQSRQPLIFVIFPLHGCCESEATKYGFSKCFFYVVFLRKKIYFFTKKKITANFFQQIYSLNLTLLTFISI